MSCPVITGTTSDAWSYCVKFPSLGFVYNIWISNKTPTHEFHFMSVLFPYKADDAEPQISKIDEMTAAVEYNGQRDVLSFDVNSVHNPDITVDFRSFK